MNNLKLSSKMHVMIIVSAVVIAIGIAVGLIFQFVSNGYFNYGAEYSDYNSVVVDYYITEHNDNDKVKELCDEAFKNEKVSYYFSSLGETDEGWQLTFKFSEGQSTDKIKAAVNTINEKFAGENDDVVLSNAAFHEVKTELNGSRVLTFAGIAIAVAIVFQFLYFVIRYKLTMAFAALLADVHNLAIFVSLLAITHVPVGSSVVVFAVLTVLMTMIGCGFLFDRMRKNLKDESFAKLDVFEQADKTSGESFINICITSIGIAASALLILVLMAISALSLTAIVTPVVLALISAVASVYGTAFFTPSVYPRFKKIGDDFKAKHSKKAKNS